MGERRKRRMSVEGWIDPIFAPGFYIAPVGRLICDTDEPFSDDHIDWAEVADFLNH